MAAITTVPGCVISPRSLQELFQHCSHVLPNYAIPRFLRVQQELDVTVTFKQLKMDLVKQAFHPEKCGSDRLYCVDFRNNTFVLLDLCLYREIEQGRVRL